MRTLMPVIALILLIAAAGGAQETGGALDGTVSEADGRPIPGAVVSVGSLAGPATLTATTDASGYFRLAGLPVGSVAAVITCQGHEDVRLPEIAIRLGRTTSLGAIQLTGQTYELPALVVKGSGVPIDAYSASVGDDLLRREFGSLPVDRNYRSLATLLPEVNVSYLGDESSFCGSTGLDNRYFIDGMDVTDPFRGVSGTNLPYNFIKAVEVRSNGYEAEYRSSLGGILNVVTLDGSDELHGSVFGFFANNRLAGEKRQGALEPAVGTNRAYDGGITLHGPLVTGKAWFAAAYNPSHTLEQVEIPGTGLHDDVADRQAFAGKVRWQASDDLRLQLAVVGDPETRSAVGETYWTAYFGVPLNYENPDPYLGDMESGGVNTHLRVDWFTGENSDLQLDLTYVAQQYRVQPATARGREELPLIDYETATASGGFPTRLDAESDVVTATVRNRWYLGSHDLLIGAAWRDNRLDGDCTFESLDRYAADTFVDWTVGARGVLHNRIPSAFVQDSWRLDPRWRLNLGLRWDGQYLIGTDGKQALSITNQYQPRVGVVFQPGQLGTQRIFATFGRFYQELSLYAASFACDPGSYIDVIAYDHDPRIDPTGGIRTLDPAAPEIQSDMKGQHYDEFSLGWERALGDGLTVGVRGVYRSLREAIEDAESTPGGGFIWGNPGRGGLADYPRARREYRAIVLSAGGPVSASVDLRASYTLSRLEGNYPGLFNSDYALPFPNYNGSFDILEMTVNSDGLLPNDRPHVLKLAGTWRTGRGLTVGTFASLAAGTPLSIFESSSVEGFFNFAQERGTAGRLPAIWDLNLRFTYDMSWALQTAWQPHLILDVFHLGSARTVVMQDQIRNFRQDEVTGEQIDPNPTYGMPVRHQSPTTVRLGMEVFF